MAPGTIEQMAEAAGYRVHERAQDSWSAVFEMLVLQGRFAELTRAQTQRRGLDLIGSESPRAVLARLDHGLAHLDVLSQLLEGARGRLKLAMEGAAQAA